MPAPAELRAPGLRERKKERTRETIRAHALHLFVTQGYDATTVQQIIDEVEVSESTFFRYFPTKGDVVLTDDFDPIIVAAFLRQPPELSPIQALRRAFNETFGQLTAARTWRSSRSGCSSSFRSPSCARRCSTSSVRQCVCLAAVLAERTGAVPTTCRWSRSAGAVVGVAMAVMFTMIDDPAADLAAVLDEAMGRPGGRTPALTARAAPRARDPPPYSSPMRLATWNVNSVVARLPRLVEWLASSSPDVLCLQETKIADDAFPRAEVEALGYEVALNGDGRWNGVAIISRVGLGDVERGFAGAPGFPETEARAMSATCGGLRVWSLYVPNGRALDSDHYPYKLQLARCIARRAACRTGHLPTAVHLR